MIESTRIPDEWSRIINSYFDAVIVPDEFLVEVYTKLVVLKNHFHSFPHPVYLDEFLERPAKQPQIALFLGYHVLLQVTKLRVASVKCLYTGICK